MMSTISGSSSTTRMSKRLLLLFLVAGHARAECGALTQLTFNGKCAAMELHERPSDRQSEAAAGLLLRQGLTGPVELVEDALLVARGEARASVRDGNLDETVVPPGGHAYFTALGRVFNGIAQQVDQHLFHALAIGQDGRQARLATHLHALLFCREQV